MCLAHCPLNSPHYRPLSCPATQTQQVVEAELDAYCKPFVTPGSYCLVEDGKLSRMGAYGGPLQAVQKFLKANPDFTADRSRELMWSQASLACVCSSYRP